MMKKKSVVLCAVFFLLLAASAAWFWAVGQKQECNPLCFVPPDRSEKVSFVVLHHFSSSPEDAISNFNKFGFSTHYIIDTEGNVIIIVPEDKIAWHAGVSFWHGEESLNRISIGIELQHDNFGQTPFSEKQIAALKPLLEDIIKRYNIRPENIVGHSDIAPDAKPDPGKAFPWQELAQSGIGLWYDINDADKMENYSVKELLDTIGYDTKGDNLVSSAYAFRRRFLPEQVAYEPDMAMRGDAIFNARFKASSLPKSERAAALKNVPRIHPEDDGTFLTDTLFIRTLRAVAYSYKKARDN